jgi:hypothetical protein
MGARRIETSQARKRRNFLRAHRPNDFHCPCGSELCHPPFVIPPVQRQAEQWVTKMVLVRRVQIHVVASVSQMLAAEEDVARSVVVIERRPLPFRPPGGFHRFRNNRIVHDSTLKNGKARGVSYIDATAQERKLAVIEQVGIQVTDPNPCRAGEEVFQPAELVFLASWTLNNTRLLLLSGIGESYDPETGKGTLGRNLTHQVRAAVRAFFEKPFNRFMGSGGGSCRRKNERSRGSEC